MTRYLQLDEMDTGNRTLAESLGGRSSQAKDSASDGAVVPNAAAEQTRVLPPRLDPDASSGGPDWSTPGSVSGLGSRLESHSGVDGRTTLPTVVSAAERWREPVEQALRAEEVTRARVWAAIVFLLSSVALAYLPLLPGSASQKAAFAVSLGWLVIASAWAWIRTRNVADYTPLVFRVFGWSCVLASAEIVYFMGVFSPTPLVVTLGIMFIGLGLDRIYAVVMPSCAIVIYTTLTCLTIVGVIPDNGLISGASSTIFSKVFLVTAASLVLTMALWLARVSRRSMIEAVRRSMEAMLVAGEREAQLAEVRDDLEQALRAAAGQSGRYSGAAAGRYQLGEVIGRGAMGEVYAGVDPTTGERAAVKVLRGDLAAAPNSVARFLREGELAGSLRCPHVVKVYATGALTDGVPFLAMELLEGEDLAALLRRKRNLERDEILELCSQVSRGLDAAHAVGIVHRDLKPHNLFYNRAIGEARGQWKVLDFGISKTTGSQGTLTQRGVLGTPGYMSPEQARGKKVDRRADVFALGAVLYRSITGRPPFGGNDLPQVLFDVVYKSPLRPSGLVERLPEDVEAVLAIALAKAPDHRFDSAHELSDALRRAYSHRLSNRYRQLAKQLVAERPWDQLAEPVG